MDGNPPYVLNRPYMRVVDYALEAADSKAELLVAWGYDAGAEYHRHRGPRDYEYPDECTGGGVTHALRVLVVDDDGDTAESSAELLRIWGHDVRVAESGEKALAVVAAFTPDVFLLDIGMPRMSGYELAGRFYRRFRKSLLVAVTGYTEAEHRALGEKAGFDLFLAKPVDPDVLETLLLLERDRLAKSLSATTERGRRKGSKPCWC
jgi:CheY-like chemotaxis protein